MILRLSALLMILAAASPAVASERWLPADLTRDLELVAARLDESLITLRNEETFASETRATAQDLRELALRCLLRGVNDRYPSRLADFAERRDRSPGFRAVTRAVCDELTTLLDHERLLSMFVQIRANQNQIGQALLAWHPPYPDSEDADNPWRGSTKPLLGEVKPNTLNKGQTVTIRHTIRWREYPDDRLRVTIEASNPTITVPAKLELDFEKHDLWFEYAVTAGNEAGTFTITLTPEAGGVVHVSVTVR